MPEDAVFTMTLDAELRAAFMAEAAAEDRPASQVVRELMRDYIERRRQSRDDNTYLHRKVEAGRASMRAGQGRPNDEVKADFAARRARLAGADA
ncbi:hypothetical protein [Tistrella mobilis]